MEVFPEGVIETGKTYKIELHFPGANWLTLQGVKLKVLLNCDSLDIGAKWIAATGDTLFLEYHLKATGRYLTHGELFQEAIKTADDGAMWIDCIDLGEREGILTPDVPMPEWLKDWKLIAGVIITGLVLLIALPYSYKRKAK